MFTYYRIRNFMRIILSVFPYLKKNPKNAYRLSLFLFYKYSGKSIIISPPTLKGLKMAIDPDSGIDRTIFFRGIAHRELVDFLLKNVKTNSVFFDIGSHSGYFSLLAAHIANKGQVYSFDPQPKSCNLLKYSISLNHINNIKVNQVCVGNRDGFVNFFISSQTDASSIMRTPYQGRVKSTKCKITRLDSYCKKNNIKKINFIKIDTEGAEKAILFSSKDLLKKYRPVLIVEFANDAASTFNFHPNELYDYLKDLGYNMYNFKRNKLYIMNKKRYYAENVFCIPDKFKA